MSDTENLKEKYPEFITLETLRQILHVSKRRAAWMLTNGIIAAFRPYFSNGFGKLQEIG